MKELERIEWRVPSYLIPGLVNSDLTGLTDREEQELRDLEHNMALTCQAEGGSSSTLIVDYDTEFMHGNDVNWLGADCNRVVQVIWK